MPMSRARSRRRARRNVRASRFYAFDFFALIFGSLAAVFARRILRIEISRTKLAVCFAFATFTHPLLDMLTDGGLGVALLAPFSNERFFFPWRPIEVSPIGLGFFRARGLDVISSELIWIWLPALLLLTAAALIRKLRKSW